MIRALSPATDVRLSFSAANLLICSGIAAGSAELTFSAWLTGVITGCVLHLFLALINCIEKFALSLTSNLTAKPGAADPKTGLESFGGPVGRLLSLEVSAVAAGRLGGIKPAGGSGGGAGTDGGRSQ